LASPQSLHGAGFVFLGIKVTNLWLVEATHDRRSHKKCCRRRQGRGWLDGRVGNVNSCVDAVPSQQAFIDRHCAAPGMAA
jgi:hypothetical protein